MSQNILEDIILNDLKKRLSEHDGLSIFARERSKFERWLQVELCDILVKKGRKVCPERDRIDIVIDDRYAVELKTINTNLKYPGVKNKTRPITKNTKSVIKDIHKLNSKNYEKKFVLFIVFPAEHANPFWCKQLVKIEQELLCMQHREFMFVNKIPGIIYFCEITG